MVDEVLYKHYERRFEYLVRALPSPVAEEAGAMLDGLPKAKVGKPEYVDRPRGV